MVTLATFSTPRVGDSAIEKIEVKLTHKKTNKKLYPTVFVKFGQDNKDSNS